MQSFIVVDDSRAVQSIIRRVIVGRGYGSDSVRTASSGEEALRLVSATRPDLVITDWHMPGISGLELVRTLRRSGYRQVKVGIVTTELAAARLLEARDSGVEFIVHKPFQDAELTAAIERSVGAPLLAPVTGEPSGAAAGDRRMPQGFVDVAAVTQALSATLPENAYSLNRIDAIELDEKSGKVLLGLYSKNERKSVDALCVMDMACAGMIGSFALGYGAEEMHSALASDSGREKISEPVSAFLTQLAALIPSADKKPFRLARSNIMGFDIAPLQKALQRNAGMEVYELQVAGFGRGRFAFLKLSA